MLRTQLEELLAHGVDNDHTREWPEGPTHQTNLAPFTRTPHRAETHAGFRVEQIKNGLLHWMTPGRATSVDQPLRDVAETAARTCGQRPH
ncbi:hypothetical protein [Enemella dayhoffiae]|uniref:hypothetical protein n=1 Tax=Enemella dayhoffiae TaxID=2016507 RepID=UPI001140001E|nr:hypothetical protein [Enemella dayhoffiae]